jgi:acyl-CoA reductase-like NAD-dependent aldehyde dehydrogenase
MAIPSSDTRTKIAGVEVSTAHWIGGRRVPSNRTFEDFSPIDGKHLANISAGGAAEADAAVAAPFPTRRRSARPVGCRS